MPVSATYVAREASTNLWRNRLLTIAGILTVAVSLALVGTTLLLKQGAANATVRWQQGVDAIVWVQPQASQAQIRSVGHQITATPYVKRCTYYDQRYDYSEAQRDLPADLAQATTLQDIPSSYRCVLNQPTEAAQLAQQFRGKPGIDGVSYPGQQIKNMESVIHIVQWIFLVVAVVLLASAAVLILNTIRMAIFARRREVSVMKLVGATNWFIRLPFMAEGFVQGIAGAAVAVGVVFGLYFWLGLDHIAAPGQQQGFLSQLHMGMGEVIGTAAVVVVVGVGVGVAGSALAVRRFLDV